ncbi:MAG TPA: FtsH protease activity modulator HflK [Steroidobacteraceae bacterium]|jgi:membrane protease subunit HflK
MAWNQPGDEKKRPPARSAPDNSSLDDLLRRLQRQAQRLWRPGGNRATTAVSLLLLAVALWLISGIHQIAGTERGVVQRFGRYLELDPPGYSWHWPWPIETVRKLDVTDVEAIDSKALMLASDQSVIDVSWSIQYRIADPLQFLFHVRDPQESLRQSSEAVLRELVAGNSPTALLDGDAPARIAVDARGRVQKIVDGYGAGISVAAVNLVDVRLPDAVQAAQRDANKAAEDRQHELSDAQAYAADIVPRAQAAAQQRISEAQVYATQTRATAEGDAERFTAQAQAFAKAPEVTRTRMYIDTMESILAKAHKIIIDTKGGNGSGNVIYVPLDKLAEAIRAGAPAVAAPGTAPGATPPTAPAPASNAAGTTPASPSETPDDAHDRERPER